MKSYSHNNTSSKSDSIIAHVIIGFFALLTLAAMVATCIAVVNHS